MKGVSEVDKVKRLSWFGGLDVGSLFHPSVALSFKNKVGVVGRMFLLLREFDVLSPYSRRQE